MIIILPTGTGFIVGASPLSLLGAPTKRKPLKGAGSLIALTAAAFSHHRNLPVAEQANTPKEAK